MMKTRPPAKLNLFGVALDPTDDELKLQFKAILVRDRVAGRLRFRNPYEALHWGLQDLIDEGLCRQSGEIEVPSWLTPAPGPEDLPRLTAADNLRFLDDGGCHEYAERVRSFLEARPADGIPAMIAVDHSMAGGALRAIGEEYGPSNVTVLVLDSHFDGLGFAERMDLFHYGRGQGLAGSGCGRLDLYSAQWAETTATQAPYDCATWLGRLLDEQVVMPDNLIVCGVSDYPTEEMRQDPQLSRYCDAYLRFERKGVAFVTKEAIRRVGARAALEPWLRDRTADFLYVSLDADVGSLDCVHAARFMNVVGLRAQELCQLGHVLQETLQVKQWIGLDVSGIETFLLGRQFPNGVKDRTIERLSDFVRTLLGREP
jgi:arginase family enzyme